LRGFGRSNRPDGVAAYSLQNAVRDVAGILDAFGIDAADIVGHDWGAAVAWFTATAHRDRVHKLVVLSIRETRSPDFVCNGLKTPDYEQKLQLDST
jgi:pimeloyl-ACP methyl ester carboxylesterase